MKNNKSAKDIAFDKERAEFRKQIRELEREIRDKELNIRELKDVIVQKDTEIDEKNDWINRLLEYMDLSEEEFAKFRENEKIKSDFKDGCDFVDKIFSRYFGRFF